MNTKQAFLEINAEVDVSGEQAEMHQMSLDELSLVGGGQDTATLG